MTTTMITVDRWTDITITPLTYTDQVKHEHKVIQIDTECGDERTITELSIGCAEQLIEALKAAITAHKGVK